jgi:polysaccharide export outer membrane protein
MGGSGLKRREKWLKRTPRGRSDFGNENLFWLRSCAVAALVLIGSGCSLFREAPSGNASNDGSLEGALAGLVPLPFDTPGSLSASDRADLEAASAAAATVGDADFSHFNEAGDPLLRTGLVLAFSLRVGDRVEVEPMRLQVMDKGEVVFPMAGTVACDGLTLPHLKRVLEERYSAFYREPQISLEFLYEPDAVSPWGRVLVQGRVAGEGWVNIPPTRDLTVSRAIQVAGGYSTSAKKSAIIVTRRKSGGRKEVLKVDLERVGTKGEIERDIRLLPGDVVYVPQSVI